MGARNAFRLFVRLRICRFTVARRRQRTRLSLRSRIDARRAPMPGSKRVPIIEIDANGAASIDLWCASLRGQASVAEDSISIVPGPIQPTQCPADRQSGDESLLAALAQVTNWKRTGDVIELRGATTLRFRLMTN